MTADNTVFHKIMRREIPAQIVYEDDRVLAFRDIQPVAPAHVLVIPKETIASLREARAEHERLLGHMLLVCAQLAREEGLDEDGYRVVVNAGRNGGQAVFQLHLHLLGGRPMTWPPG